MITRTALLFQLLCLSLGTAATSQFLPPGVLNPTAASDSENDGFPAHVVDAAGTIHVVWASEHDVTGDSGPDWDIFYARLSKGIWSAPELVSAEPAMGVVPTSVDNYPRLVAFAGKVEVVWQGRPVDNSGESDIYYARRYNWGWSGTFRLNGSPGLHADSRPNLIRRSDGVLVAWERSIQGKSSLWWTYRMPDSQWFGSPRQLNNHINGDGTGDHLGPVALASASGGKIVAAWVTDETVNGALDPGPDLDVVYAELGALPSENWSDWSIVHVEATSDSAVDREPAVAIVSGQYGDEYHFVWSSEQDIGGTDFDSDLVHAVIVPRSQSIGFAWPVNTSAGTDAVPDGQVSICVEPGGVLHAVWSSPLDLFTGTDWDVYYAMNARGDEHWTKVGLLGWNAPFDGPGAHDVQPQIACAGDGILSGVWASSDPLGGPYGTDFDILHAVGIGTGVSRPRLVDDNHFRVVEDSDLQIVADGSGRLHAVWSSDHHNPTFDTLGPDADIYYAWRDDHGWSKPEVMNTSAYWDSGHDGSPQLGIDNAGRVHVVWVSDESFAGVYGLDRDLFYSVRDSEGFSAPVPVNDAEDDGGQSNRIFSLAIGGEGTVHVIWNKSASLMYTTGNETGVFATSPAVVGATYANVPRMVLDHNGQPHVVFVYVSSTTANGDGEIGYQKLENGVWSPLELINDAAGDASAHDFYPDLAIDSQGRIHVVWASNRDVGGAGADMDLLYSRMDASGWTTPAPLFDHARNDSGIDEAPRVIMDRSDTLHVLWESTDPLGGGAGTDKDLFYASIAPGSLFPSPAPIRMANANGWADEWEDTFPSLAVDFRGQAHFAWTLFRNLGNQVDWFDALYANIPRPALVLSSEFESADLDDWTSVP